MEGKILHNLGLILVLSCVIIVAKNESEKTINESKNITSTVNPTNLENQNIFTESGSKIAVETADEPKKSKVKGRKGVSFEDLKSPMNETTQSSSSTSVTVHPSTSLNNSTTTIKLVTSTPVASKNASTEVSRPVTSATVKSTVKSTTTSSTTTTKKPIGKPTITYSADDSDAIKESEKNINYNVGKEKSSDDPAPKLEQDVDRAVLEEKRARKGYMIYLGMAVVLPLAVVAINLAYKRVKNYLELREYQRVDFLVDGMYVS